MKIAIAASMKFAKEIIEAKKILEQNGHSTIIPENTENYAKGIVEIENKQEKIELNVIKSYYEQIKNADASLIINKDKNGIKNYIGGNSLIEMAFAHVHDKKIFLLHPIPDIGYSDEIWAMKPIILDSDLNRIK